MSESEKPGRLTASEHAAYAFNLLQWTTELQKKQSAALNPELESVHKTSAKTVNRIMESDPTPAQPTGPIFPQFTQRPQGPTDQLQGQPQAQGGAPAPNQTQSKVKPT